jgi:predicted DNA-binding transcriptional regulator AlpA
VRGDKETGRGEKLALVTTPLLEEKLWGPDRLAQFLGVKVGTIYSWISRGVDFPPFVKVASVTRWRESSVKEWLLHKEQERKRRNFES